MTNDFVIPADFKQRLDTFFADQMETLQIPGAVFTLVQGEEIVISQGYGVANRLLEAPYDPVDTIVHGGSVIKVIIATAVMQQREAGHVDLHTDVNEYLRDFKLPNDFDEPITLHHLLHHTSGLDVKFNSTRAFDVDGLEPLGYYLAHALPPRIMPPGLIRNYNDFGIALAALVIQDAANVPLDRLLWENIFQPLEMTSTSLLVPEDALERLAIGYTIKDREMKPNLIGNYLLQTGPGAAFNTTAVDMAHFISAHLQNGRYQNKQILSPSLIDEMHTTQFRHHPRLPGMAFAFDELFVNGRRLLAKSGGAPGTNNRLILIPDAGIGFFVSYNRYNGRLHNQLTQRIMDTLFATKTTPVLEPTITADLTTIRGSYRELNSSSATTFEKIGSLAAQITVKTEENTLKLFGDTFVPVTDNLFQAKDNGRYAAINPDIQGKQYLFYERTAYEKLPFQETRPFQLGLVGFSSLTFLLGTVTWFSAGGGHLSQFFAAVTSAGNLLFLVGLTLFLLELNRGGEPPWEIEFGLPTPLLALLVIPLFTAVMAALMVILWVLGMIQGEITTTAVLVNTAVLLGELTFIYCLRTWNLFGYKL